MADSIRIKRKAKKIEVNDAGEYILLPLDSEYFIRDFYKSLDDLHKNLGSFKTEGVAEDDIVSGLDKVVELDDAIHAKIEHWFGDGACQKIFGDYPPGISMYTEFFESLLPFLEEYKDEIHREQEARLNKYGASRTGSTV